MKIYTLVFTFLLDSVLALPTTKQNVSQYSETKEARIVGGRVASRGEYPWIVSLQKQSDNVSQSFKHFCAGSIVSRVSVVTAAHCVWNRTAEQLSIVAGALNIGWYSKDSGTERVAVAEIHIHPKYKSFDGAGPYDIAVIKLEQELIFNEHVSPIALPQRSEEATGYCDHTGWGNRFLISGLYYASSNQLKTVQSRVIPKVLCSALYLFVLHPLLETAMCSAPGPLRGSCQGDSGGPVTCYREDNTPYLAGIVSWGWAICGDGIHPDVSTDVAQFIDFIDKYSS